MTEPILPPPAGTAESELARTTRIYETILSTTDDFAYIFDPQGRFLYANRRLLKVWAKTLDQVIGKTCHDLGYPTWHADMHMQEIEKIVRDKVQIRGEVPFTGDSGISGVYDYIFKPVLDTAGNVEVIVGTTRDVTTRKQEEEKRSEIAAKFRALFDQSSVFAGIMTPDGTLIEANSLSTLGCGYFPDDVLRKPFWNGPWWRGSKENQEKIRLGIRKAASGGSYTETLTFLLGDGTERVVDLAIHPIVNGAGKVIFLTPTGVDVTVRQRALAQTEFLAQLTQKLSLVSDAEEINRIAAREIGQFLDVDRCYFFQAIDHANRVEVLADWSRGTKASMAGIYTLSDFGSPEWWRDVQQKSVHVDNVRTHPEIRDFVSNYLRLGVEAYTLSPFIQEGHWRASIAATSDKPRIWMTDETVLLENAVARVWPLIERARLARENEATLSRIAAVVESSDDAIISKTLEGIITSWNAGAQRIFGYTAEETIGQSIFLLIPPELQKEEPGILAKLKRGERIEHYETIRLAKDGRSLNISLSVSPIKDGTGKIIGASKIARDITEEKRRQEALRESEVRFRTMADAAPMLIWESGTDKLRNYFNQTWLRFTGKTLEQESGNGWTEGIHPDDLARCLELYLSSFDARQKFEMEYRIRHHSGEYRWVLDQGSPRFGPEGTFQGYIGACVDITESVEARATMEERKEELEQLVDQRTASLKEAMAQMEEFSYSVSHDLRAPLRAMQGYATALLEDYSDKLDDEGREHLQRIVSAGTRMDRLTRDVLVYSKIPRASMMLHSVSLDRLIGDIAQQYLQATHGQAEISVETPLLPILGNEAFLGQAISNLVDNAIKFIPPGQRPQIRIHTEPRGQEVRLWIEDNGIGIPPEYQGRIWGMFERVHPQHVYEGTGIGLAIVRKTMEKMNGTMGVESDGLTGSKFWIQLPGI